MPKSLKTLLACVALVPLVAAARTEEVRTQDGACQVDTVPPLVLVEGIRAAARAHGEFYIVPGTNWIRFYSALYLGLVRDAMERRPEGGVLFFPAESFFWEFFSVSGLTDTSEAPGDLLWSFQSCCTCFSSSLECHCHQPDRRHYSSYHHYLSCLNCCCSR